MENIKLSDFISNTLIEIANGIKQANNELRDTNGESRKVFDVFELRRTNSEKSKELGVKFDVSLSATNEKKEKAGFVVALANIGGGANIENQKANDKQHRIQFEVGIKQEFY